MRIFNNSPRDMRPWHSGVVLAGLVGERKWSHHQVASNAAFCETLEVNMPGLFDSDAISNLYDRTASLCGYLAASAKRWRIYSRTLAELSLLSDRDLSDLGFNRDQIVEMARDAARRAVPH